MRTVRATYLLNFPALLDYRLDCLSLPDCPRLMWIACFLPQVMAGMQMQ